MKYVIYLVIDQLAGHWEDSVKIEGTDLPPANVKGYHEKGLIPNFSYLIDNGLWVKRPWNRGRCQTSCAMKYLATGFYSKEEFCYAGSKKKSWFLLAEKEMGFFEFAMRFHLDNLTVVTTGPIFSRGYFYVPELMQRVPPEYRALPPHQGDEAVLRRLAFPWMEWMQGLGTKWNLMHIYLYGMDEINRCPSYQEENSKPESSKHAYLLFLDGLVGEMIHFLKNKGLWDKTYIVITSDHGYHLGCSVGAEMGVKTNNWCCDHGEPWDCEVWDFKNNKSTGIYSGGPRRVTFILSGGALEEKYIGKTIEEAEIIDVIPTIAELLDVPYECEGKSILHKDLEDL
ncbi:MAG: hypothetical protein DRI26_07945 [Chloroflexi bacterium]|nr:MAG: hypothetical protein DRI26_07945 [Chloroflexota bacterium]